MDAITTMQYHLIPHYNIRTLGAATLINRRRPLMQCIHICDLPKFAIGPMGMYIKHWRSDIVCSLKILKDSGVECFDEQTQPNKSVKPGNNQTKPDSWSGFYLRWTL